MRDPYSIHVILLWEMTKLFDFALWSSRDLVRDLEKVCVDLQLIKYLTYIESDIERRSSTRL